MRSDQPQDEEGVERRLRVSGAGFRCEYTVTVTNTGPDPYHGPLKLDEELGFAPTSVSFSPDWGCVGGGAATNAPTRTWT